MKLEEHVLSAIDAFERGRKDEALLHACFSIDATARNMFSKNGKKEYKACIRHYWWLVEPFMNGGVNLEETRWSHITLDNGYGKVISDPDLADIIYHVFRCSHAHAREILSSMNYCHLKTEFQYGKLISLVKPFKCQN
jgi:hypothetical protein